MGLAVAEDACDSSSEVCSNPEGGGDSSQDTSSNSCRLYMAPTTVGGIEGNYGIFTSVDLDSGDTVLANDGPNIAVLSDDRKKSKEFPHTDHLGLFNNVWWGINAIVTDQMRSGEFDYRDRNIVDMVDLQINFGALPNCHPYMPNLQTLMPADGIDYDDRRHLTGDHAKNPLRGSFSYYTGKHFSVDRPVEAGTELFLDYASDWKQHGFPRRQDYYSAAAIVRKWILVIMEKVHDDESLNGKDPDTVFPPDVLVAGAKALLELIRVSAPDFPLDWYGEESIHERSTINKGVYEVEELTSRILSVLPQTPDEWNEVYDESWEFFFERKEELGFSPEEHKPNFPSIKDVADAMYEVSRPPPKTSQELEETGICLDHIVAGRSLAPLEVETVSGTLVDNHNMTIGRGAIAARFLAKGELVVPVPFLHLLDRALFEQLPKEAMAPGDASFSEMILNYCFGHSESTMVMCPVTNAVLVNHCSDRNGRFQCGGGMGPNAEYRWASESDWDRKTKTTLAMTLDDLAGSNYKQQHRMMSMEIVATRDIQEGEEIFIDYGDKWEEAWLKHVRNWAKDDVDSSWSSSLTAFELNFGAVVSTEDGKEEKDLLFYGSLRDPQPAESADGRFTAMCWYEDILDYGDYGLGSRHSWDPEGEEFDENDEPTKVYWKELSDEDILREYAVNVGNGGEVRFRHLKDHPPGWYGHFWPCSILSKTNRHEEDDEDRYVVRIYPSDYHHYYHGEDYYATKADHVLLKNYPRSSIRFVTLPYEADQYHPKAFRHHIEIKDEIFPEQWKNKEFKE